MLEADFRRVLSNDRVFPSIYKSASSNIDKVPAKERTQVLDVAAKILLQRFVYENRNKLQVFHPSRSSPMKIDVWLTAANQQKNIPLPENANDATKALKSLDSIYPLVSQELWAVDYQPNTARTLGLHKAQMNCLATIDGWSVCLADMLLPDDFGKSMEALAKIIAKDLILSAKPRKKAGRHNKVFDLVVALKNIYPDGTPDLPANIIERELRKSTSFNFSDTTLRKAISETKITLETAS